MGDYRDPSYRPPRDPLYDPLLRRDMDPDLAGGAGAPWGWILGAFLIAAVVIYVFSSAPTTQTATNDQQAPVTQTAPASPKAPAPSNQPR